jgi:flagellar hook-length control protein FliK
VAKTADFCLPGSSCRATATAAGSIEKLRPRKPVKLLILLRFRIGREWPADCTCLDGYLRSEDSVAAFVPEISVVRAPAPSQGTGMRPHAGADQPESPFSDLLDSCEPPVADIPASAGSPGLQVASPQGKAATPDGPPAGVPGSEIAKVQADLVLSIVMPPGQAEPEPQVPPVRTGLGAILSQAISNRPEAESEIDEPPLPEQSDADAADLAPIVETISLPIIVPVPAAVPVPLAGEASVPAADAITIRAAGDMTVPAAGEMTLPAANDITVAAAPAAATKAAPAAPPELPETEAAIDLPVDPAVEDAAKFTVPDDQADEIIPPASGGKQKKAPQLDKSLSATTQAATAAKEKAPIVSKTVMDPELPEQNAEPAAQRLSSRPTEPSMIINAAASDDVTDAKAKAAAAPLPQDVPANSTLVPPPPAAVHVAAMHAVQSQQPSPPDLVPVAGLAVAIAAHAQGGKTHFEIRLDPPELGRIDVRLDVDGAGQVTSHLRVDRAETLDLLRRDAPALERALQQAGLKTSDSGLQFSLRDQSFSQQNQSRDIPVMARIVVPDEILVPPETQRQYGRLAGLGSGVDISV